jgi:phage shock protein A
MTNIFSRFRDIVSANLNAMLDRAEDPDKMIKMMINEMEDTLVEIKADCAGAMATKKKVERALDEVRSRTDAWAEKAELAVNKGREDLAREALLEKRRYMERAEALEDEAAETQGIIDQYKEQIELLEEKINTAREKQRLLVQRAVHAQGKKKAQADIRRFDASEAIARFEQFENRIERMEAEADLVNFGRKPTLDQEFAELEKDEELERELNELKSRVAGHGSDQ